MERLTITNPHRQALRYIIRNTTLTPRVRAEAQLQLTQMHCYTNPTQIRNRCILGGKGRGVLSDFKMSRVSQNHTTTRRHCPIQPGVSIEESRVDRQGHGKGTNWWRGG